MGAHVERVVQKHTGRNVYGLSHLVEHLGFRAPKDYTTEELMQALKTEGTYNASTNHERINYWFKTTTQRAETAVRLVCNYALNDLTGIPEDEFQTEKKVVYNEAKRYADDDQTMFHFNVTPTMCGLDAEDNIIGIPDTIDTFTLDDAQLIKAIFLTQGKQVYNITYDPTAISKEKIIAMVESELDRHELPEAIELYRQVEAEYVDSLAHPSLNEYTIENESEQVMTALMFDTMRVTNMIAARIGNEYLSRLSPTSLTDLIREQNGLTYGLYLYDDNISYAPYAVFGCDVTKGTEDLMLELFEQSVEESTNGFDEAAYERLMDTVELKRTLAFVDQEKYDRIFWTALWYPELIEAADGKFIENVDQAYELLNERLATYDNIRLYLETFVDHVKERKYGKATNLQG
jgi:predicted Zn-dependent peptidase